MATDLPLESVPDRFLDEIPADWSWQPGDRNLPIILSSQFFDIYNYVFAPGQGLPQLSRTSVRSIGIKLQVGEESGQTLSAHVSGFSDRIGSVLAPQSFIDYGNKTYSGAAGTRRPSQLILKVNDPSDTKFTDYLLQHGYTANPQELRWSRMRAIVEVVAGATGILALLLIGISTLVFVMFIELTVTRAHSSLVLLRELGYSTKYLRAFMSRYFIPTVTVAMLLSLACCVIIQYMIAIVAGRQGLMLPSVPGWPVWAVFGTCFILLYLLISRSLRNALKE